MKRQQRGFSLIELMMAMGVTVVVLLGAVLAFRESVQGQQQRDAIFGHQRQPARGNELDGPGPGAGGHGNPHGRNFDS